MSDIQAVLENRTGNHLMPFLWYAGESPETVCRALESIRSSGIRGVTLENRGGNWFNTERWWTMLERVFAKAEELGMEVWMLDDSHVATGSANDTLKQPENARFRPKNLRVEAVDVVGPQYGALYLPNLAEGEAVVEAIAYRRDEERGVCLRGPVELTGWADGLLPIELGEGLWRVFFVVQAAPERQGFWSNYITMLSKESCRHLIDEVHEKMYARCGRHFGKVFRGFFSDEPGFGNCNGEYDEHFKNNRLGNLKQLVAWWEDMPGRLAAELGEDLESVRLNLPALWDAVEGESERYQLAYMNVITRLWRDNFTMPIGDWCRAHGVEYIGHYVEDETAHLHMGFGCGHFMRTMDGQDMAGIDFVLNEMTPGITTLVHTRGFGKDTYGPSAFYQYALGRMGSSLANHNPRMKGRLMAEVMGGYGWTAGLAVMRALFNHSLANGVNYFVPHAFSMVVPTCFQAAAKRDDSDFSTLPPGYCMTFLPPSFDGAGFNPQYRGFARLVAHIQRTAELMTGGTHLADAAVFYNAECDWMDAGTQDISEVAMALTRGNLDFDFLSLDMLHNAEVRDGRLWESGVSFSCLVLPGTAVIPAELLDLLERFADAGLPVVMTDQRPMRTEKGADLRLADARFRLVPSAELASCVKGICAPHLPMAAAPELRFYCLRMADGTERVLFLNEGMHEVETVVGKPVAGAAALYDPWTNRCFRPEETAAGVRLKLRPQQLLVLCFGVEPADVPAFRYDLPPLAEMPLEYTLHARGAGETEKRLVGKGTAEALQRILRQETRACAEYFYEAEMDCDRDCEVLQVPATGDCTTLLVNGKEVGTDFGTPCVFDVRGLLKAGRNRIAIVTADNPSYADRFPLSYGQKMPLQPHGIVKAIRLG